MNVKHLLAAAVLMPGMFVMQSAGNASVAVIDFDRAVASTPEGKDAISKLTAFRTERQTAIEEKLKQAEELADRLRSQGRAMSDSARAQLTTSLQTAQTEIETLEDEAQNKLEQMRQQLLVPVEAKTARAVSTYANERGFKVVLDASVLREGLAFVHDTADITTEIMRRTAADIRKSPADPMARSFQRNWFDGARLHTGDSGSDDPAGSRFASRRIALTSFSLQP